MNIIFSLTIGILFGTGVYLILKRSLLRMIIGINLISNSVILFIIAAGLYRGQVPIYPLDPDAPISDPLVQALVLTAVVINFGVTILLLSLVYRIFISYGTIDQQALQATSDQEVRLSIDEVEANG